MSRRRVSRRYGLAAALAAHALFAILLEFGARIPAREAARRRAS